MTEQESAAPPTNTVRTRSVRRGLAGIYARVPTAVLVAVATYLAGVVLLAGMGLLHTGRDTVAAGRVRTTSCHRDIISVWLTYTCRIDPTTSLDVEGGGRDTDTLTTRRPVVGVVDVEVRVLNKRSGGKPKSYIVVRKGTPHHSGWWSVLLYLLFIMCLGLMVTLLSRVKDRCVRLSQQP